MVIISVVAIELKLFPMVIQLMIYIRTQKFSSHNAVQYNTTNRPVVRYHLN